MHTAIHTNKQLYTQSSQRHMLCVCHTTPLTQHINAEACNASITSIKKTTLMTTMLMMTVTSKTLSKSVHHIKAVWYVLPVHKPGSRHCHLAIRHCAIRQRVFDRKICFNVLNYVFILYIFNLWCIVNIQQHCHNASHCDWRHHL